jgi:hypothetical protein
MGVATTIKINVAEKTVAILTIDGYKANNSKAEVLTRSEPRRSRIISLTTRASTMWLVQSIFSW